MDLRQAGYQRALSGYQEALPIAQTIGDRLGQAYILRGLVEVKAQLGPLADARHYYREVLALFRDIRGPVGLGHTLRSLGNLDSRESLLPGRKSQL